MRAWKWAWIGALAASMIAGVGAPAAADAVRLSGKVVDASGKPAAGVLVSTGFGFSGGKLVASAKIRSGADGTFSGEVMAWREAFLLGAYTEDGARAGWARVAKAPEVDGIVITLQPTVRVSGKVTCTEMGATPTWVNTMWEVPDLGTIASMDTRDGEFEVLLPPGTFDWNLYDSYFTSRKGRIEVKAGEGDRSIGTIDLPAAFLAKNKGKVLPDWKVTEARGLDPSQAVLSSMRGKWVLVEFWGYW